jgi:hypothetical protein
MDRYSSKPGGSAQVRGPGSNETLGSARLLTQEHRRQLDLPTGPALGPELTSKVGLLTDAQDTNFDW